jgi:hypothetical protein
MTLYWLGSGGGDSAIRRRADRLAVEELERKQREARHPKRGGNPKIKSYSDQSAGFDIGRNRTHDKATSSGFANSLNPGQVPLTAELAERPPFARVPVPQDQDSD